LTQTYDRVYAEVFQAAEVIQAATIVIFVGDKLCI